MITFYKAHKGDYYCRELPFRIFKGRGSWRVQKLIDNPITRACDSDSSTLKNSFDESCEIEYYADTLTEAKSWLQEKESEINYETRH